MRVTLKDVAKASNLSVAATSMALNGRPGISEETRKKVISIAKRLEYTPNPLAQSLVNQKSKEIGLVVPEITNPFFASIVDIINKMTENMGYTMILGISNDKSKREKEYIEMFVSRRTQGVIIVPSIQKNPDFTHIETLRNLEIPFVFCTDTYPGCTETCVLCDFRKGEYELVRYLLQKGMRRIVLMTADFDFNFAKLRLEGYKQAFAEAGLRIDHDMIVNIEYPNFEAAYAATDRVLEKKPDAICCINDIMAIGVMKRLREREVKVPGEIAVAGFDDTMFSALAQTPITTVRQPMEEICRTAIENLENKIQKTDEKDYTYFIPAELIVRDTTP